jgi:hypothetical protein
MGSRAATAASSSCETACCSVAGLISGRPAPTPSAAAPGRGHLATNQHTGFADAFVRPLFGGQVASSGFSGTFADDAAEVFGTVLVGSRSLSFRATLKKLADA